MPATVEIEYCVPCGFRERALDLERAILNACEREIDRCSLLMGDHGVFAVRVDGQTVFDKTEEDFDVDRIVRQVREAI